MELGSPNDGAFKTSKNLVLMRSGEGFHVPRGAVPDVTGLRPRERLLEVTAEGLTHFLPIGHHALGSLNSGSPAATGGRTWCPVTKLPKRLCRKEMKCHDSPE